MTTTDKSIETYPGTSADDEQNTQYQQEYFAYPLVKRRSSKAHGQNDYT